MPWRGQVALQEYRCIAESFFGLTTRPGNRIDKIGGVFHWSHTFPAATSICLDQQGIARRARCSLPISHVVVNDRNARDHGDASVASGLFSNIFEAHLLHSSGWWTNPDESCLRACCSKRSVFR